MSRRASDGVQWRPMPTTRVTSSTRPSKYVRSSWQIAARLDKLLDRVAFFVFRLATLAKSRGSGMSVALNDLLERYQRLEERFPVFEADGKYSGLVRANGNGTAPVQRWFHFKEAYSLDLLETLLTDWDIPGRSIHKILDPFCGVGTTLLASQMLAKKQGNTSLEAIGFERNPFLHFAAETKTRWYRYDEDRFQAQTRHLMNGAVSSHSRPIPPLATLNNPLIFEPPVIQLALAFQEAIQRRAAQDDEYAPLLLGYASVLEDISGVRKDGRALRIAPNKQRKELRAALYEIWTAMLADVIMANDLYSPIATDVVLGDGRTLAAEGARSPDVRNTDVIMYSPPYLNNIDYTEVYKVEAWMCGFIQTQEQFRDQRLKTMRSHPSVLFTDPVEMEHDERLSEVREIVELLIAVLPRDRYFRERSRGFRGYFDDMYRSLSRQIEVLRPGGWGFCVVGNSLHGPKSHVESRVPVASDLIIALIASSLGFEIRAVQIARHLTRRLPTSHYVRESILVMQKPS